MAKKTNNIIHCREECFVSGTSLVMLNIPVLNSIVPLSDLWGLHGVDSHSKGYLIQPSHMINCVDLVFSCSYISTVLLGVHRTDRATREQTNSNPLAQIMAAYKNLKMGVGPVECTVTLERIRTETTVSNVDLSKYTNKQCKIDLMKHIQATFTAAHFDKIDCAAYVLVNCSTCLMAPLTVPLINNEQKDIVLFYTDFFRSNSTTPLEYMELHKNIQRFMQLAPLPDLPDVPQLECLEQDGMDARTEIEMFIDEQGSEHNDHGLQSIEDILADIDYLDTSNIG